MRDLRREAGFGLEPSNFAKNFCRACGRAKIAVVQSRGRRARELCLSCTSAAESGRLEDRLAALARAKATRRGQ